MGTRIPVTGGLCKEDAQGSLGACPERGDGCVPEEPTGGPPAGSTAASLTPKTTSLLCPPPVRISSASVPGLATSCPIVPLSSVCVSVCLHYLLPHRPPVQNRAEQTCHTLAPMALLQHFPSQQRPPHTRTSHLPLRDIQPHNSPRLRSKATRVAGLSLGTTLPTTNVPAALCSLHLQMQVPLLFGE